MRIDEIKFGIQGPQIHEVDICNAEKELGFSLPKDYRDFLLRYNGGISKLYVTADESVYLWHWFSLATNERNMDLLASNKSARDSAAWKNFILIALTLSDHYVVMRMNPPNQYAIGVYNWEIDFDVEKIALPFKSFTDFLDKLHYEECV